MTSDTTNQSTTPESKVDENVSKPSEDKTEPVLEDEWVDLLGSGSIMKKIVKEGQSDTRPQRLEKVVLNYKLTLEDGTLVESKNNFELQLGDSEVHFKTNICYYMIDFCIVGSTRP